MTEDDPLVNVSRDLAEIVRLADDLEEQAVAKADDPDLPGGLAMVMLGPVANLEAWRNRQETIERLWWEDEDATLADRPDTYAAEDESWEPPLQTLLFWSEDWREYHGKVSDLRPTISSEAAFLRGILEWAYENEPHWSDFVSDIAAARVRLENVLYAGIRTERSQVPCIDCDMPPRLVKIHADKAKYDHWRCPRCKRRYSPEEFNRARYQHLTSQGADRFVPVPVAIAAVKPRPEHTVRTWMKRMQVARVCLISTRQVVVWWPDVRRLNEEAKRRKGKRSRRRAA